MQIFHAKTLPGLVTKVVGDMTKSFHRYKLDSSCARIFLSWARELLVELKIWWDWLPFSLLNLMIRVIHQFSLRWIRYRMTNIIRCNTGTPQNDAQCVDRFANGSNREDTASTRLVTKVVGENTELPVVSIPVLKILWDWHSSYSIVSKTYTHDMIQNDAHCDASFVNS